MSAQRRPWRSGCDSVTVPIGSVVLLALLWRELGHISHADETALVET